MSRALALRQFSTSSAARFVASRTLFESQRTNPLVGSAPKPQVQVPPPPPPPLPQQIEIPPATSQTKESAASYDATKPANAPIVINIAELVGQNAASYTSVHADPLSGPKIRAKAVAGRTVFIKDRLTPTSAPTPMVALRVLDRMCREQKIRTKFHSQKFHERKGLKKKRLRSQRWRARFKTGFKAAVSRVIELKKQGW